MSIRDKNCVMTITFNNSLTFSMLSFVFRIHLNINVLAFNVINAKHRPKLPVKELILKSGFPHSLLACFQMLAKCGISFELKVNSLKSEKHKNRSTVIYQA